MRNINILVLAFIAINFASPFINFAAAQSGNYLSIQENIMEKFIPQNYSLAAQMPVNVDQQQAMLSRYVRRDGVNSQIGGEHFSVVYRVDGHLLGFTRMDGELVGKALPSRDETEKIAMAFLKDYAPDLLINASLNFIEPHDETITLENGGQNQAVTLTGMKVKMRNKSDGLYFWVIVGADKKVMTFERDIYWQNRPYGHRRTEMWLHDQYLTKNKIKLDAA